MTICHQESDVVGVNLTSPLIATGRKQLGLFLDFPWNDGSSKFEAPFVGAFNMTANHTTELIVTKSPDGSATRAQVIHTLVNNTFITTVSGSSFNISRVSPDEHKYILSSLHPSSNESFLITISYALQAPESVPNFETVKISSEEAWTSYWSSGGFVDLYSDSADERADELQRRIILSQYLLRVNEAGDFPPQEVRRFNIHTLNRCIDRHT